MLNTTHTFTSKVQPSITVTLRHLTVARRMQLDREQAPFRQRRRDLMVRYAESEIDPGVAEGPKCEHCGHIAITKPGDAPSIISSKLADRTILIEEIKQLDHEMLPQTIRAFVSRVDERDGDSVREVPIDELLEDAQEELLKEIESGISARVRLNPEQSKNSPSPTTSGPQVGEIQKAETAQPASENAST